MAKQHVAQRAVFDYIELVYLGVIRRLLTPRARKQSSPSSVNVLVEGNYKILSKLREILLCYADYRYSTR